MFTDRRPRTLWTGDDPQSTAMEAQGFDPWLVNVPRQDRGKRPTGCGELQAALACVDALRESVPTLRGPELVEAVCGIEVLTRKTHAAMLELLAGLDAAKVAGDQSFGTTSRLLSAMLDLSAGQARARVRDAEQLATRRSLTGEPLPALLPATAAALASGAIAPDN